MQYFFDQSQLLQFGEDHYTMKSAFLIFFHLHVMITIIKADISPRTNCLFHSENKVFVLLDLKNGDPYFVQTASKDQIYFNFCDAFTLPQCNRNESYLGYLIRGESKQCYPLTSVHSGKFQIQYGYEEEIEQNVLALTFHKDSIDKYNYQLNMKIICSEKQFEIVNSGIFKNQVEVITRSIHGCPVYQMPALMQLIDEYQIIVTIFCFLIGFLFLFYGRVMIHITAFFSIATILIIYLTLLCFRFMEQNIEEIYLYLTLVIILISSFVISYFIVKSFVKASLFFIGALFGFFAGTLIKAFVLALTANQTRLLFLINGLMNFVTVAIMVLLGSLTLEHKQEVIIYSTTLSGSYLIIRGLSLLIGGFPCQFQIFDLVQSKRISSIPISFYIYLLLILLLAAIGGIYQQLKLAKERNSGESQSSRSSQLTSRVSSYIEGNLDKIHDQIEKIIDRYRMSQISHFKQGEKEEEHQSQQLNNYKKINESQQDR